MKYEPNPIPMMNFGFWKQLPRPFTALAPMSGVTDAAFRRILAKYGKPDITWTEFVSADGLCSVGRERLMQELLFADCERPIVAQIFGGNPAKFEEASRLVVKLGFDGIDINMGCPAPEVEKRIGGAALMKNLPLAAEIIQATHQGAGGLPVSIKTRIGYSDNDIESWMGFLMENQPAAITIHARTRDEESKVPARWDVVKQAVDCANAIQPSSELRPPIIGNGDVKSLAEMQVRVQQTGCDGVMVGRGVIGNPWLFNKHSSKNDFDLATILGVMIEHTELHMELETRNRAFEQMKKHFQAYVKGFNGAAILRAKLMEASEISEIKATINEALAYYSQAETTAVND